MRLQAEGPGEVTCDLIEADTSITIHNKDLVLATLTKQVDFDMEFTVQKGRGYVPASEQYDRNVDQEVGLIPVDATYSPVTRVRYKVEDTRVGQKTNYDKLTLEVWTNGTVTPEMAVVEAAKILRKHLNPFIHFFDLGKELKPEFGEELEVAEVADSGMKPEAATRDQLYQQFMLPVTELDLSVRAQNCLEAENIRTIGELCRMKEEDLVKLRNFGRVTLKEIEKKLTERGLRLGMTDDVDSALANR
jgi:DNA-directed RNA polymerase subunit alpha